MFKLHCIQHYQNKFVSTERGLTFLYILRKVCPPVREDRDPTLVPSHTLKTIRFKQYVNNTVGGNSSFTEHICVDAK